MLIIICLAILFAIGDYNNVSAQRPTPGPCINYYNTCYVADYTQDDVENARLYLQQRFQNWTHPTKPVCTSLRVRKNIKCLNETEKQIFLDTLLAAFSNQTFISYLTKIHTKYWIAEHKFPPNGVFWHSWFLLELEKQMVSINPNAALHYHDNLIEWINADQSIVWNLLGRGDPNNGYCVNGPFINTTVTYYDKNYNTSRCIRREMPNNMTWEPPEWGVAWFQMGPRSKIINPYLTVFFEALGTNPINNILSFASIFRTTFGNFPAILNLLNSIEDENVRDIDNVKLFVQVITLFAYSSHFKRHLETGGYTGDLSTPNAPNDPDFWCFHSFDELLLRLVQLNHNSYLVELTSDISFHLNYTNQMFYLNNVESDVLNYYDSTTLKESFELGFGGLCYIYDYLVVAIRDRDNFTLPEMYWRIRECLPSNTTTVYTSLMTPYEYYFPDFYQNDLPKSDPRHKPLTSFSMYLPEVGNCNPKGTGTPSCKQFITAKSYQSNPNNLRQYQNFKYNRPANALLLAPGDIDITPYVNAAGEMYEDFIKVLNENNCCSVYNYP